MKKRRSTRELRDARSPSSERDNPIASSLHVPARHEVLSDDADLAEETSEGDVLSAPESSRSSRLLFANHALMSYSKQIDPTVTYVCFYHSSSIVSDSFRSQMVLQASTEDCIVLAEELKKFDADQLRSRC